MMNKIEQLLQQYCPDGVEFVELGKLGDFYGGLTGKSKDDFTDGNAKFITYMNIFSNITIDTDVNIFVKMNPDEKQNKIQYGDVLFTGSSETPDECGMSSVLTKKTNEPLYLNSFSFGFRLNDLSLFLPDFLKYLFRDEQMRRQIGKTASGVTRFNISKKLFAKIQIPIPPIEIQQEIVKILDTFTQLEAELEAELEARKSQYVWYRDDLLSFGDDEVEWKELGDLGKIVTGRTPTSQQESHWGVGINFITPSDMQSGSKIIHETSRSLSSDEKTRGIFSNILLPKGSVLVSCIGSDMGKTVMNFNDAITNQQINSIIVELNSITPDYVYHYLASKKDYLQTLGKSGGGTMPIINKTNFTKIQIPIPYKNSKPDLEKQQQIVETLDKFDALVNDISIGLPAELQARRQQYEYYRGKLLTFKPLKK